MNRSVRTTLQNDKNSTMRERRAVEYSAAANGKRPTNTSTFNLQPVFVTERILSINI